NDSLFNGSLFGGSLFGGSFFSGSFFDGSLSSDSRTGAPMIPSTPCWLALHISSPCFTSKSQQTAAAPKQHGTTMLLTHTPQSARTQRTTSKNIQPGIKCVRDTKLQPHQWHQMCPIFGSSAL